MDFRPDALPQRVPAPPDVPEVPGASLDDDVDNEGPAALARIAEGLAEGLRDDPGGLRGDGFDFDAVLDAVRGVSGVREAAIRPNANGVHTLRLDLYDNADAARVSREVARLLKQKMGLAAEPRRAGAAESGARTLADVEQQQAPVGRPLGRTNQGPAQQVGRPGNQPPSDPNSPGSLPVAGHVPPPRRPLPSSATEQLGGPAARAGSLSSGALSSSGGAAEGTAPTPGRHPVTVPRMRNAVDGRVHPSTDETLPAPLRRMARAGQPPRVVVDEVQVRTLGIDATVEVRLTASGRDAVVGATTGPAVDGYVLRLAAEATTAAVNQLLVTAPGPEVGRCYVENAAVVALDGREVAVVVILLTVGTWVQRLSGSALVAGDPRQAIVRATLDAVNRRVDALLS